jgi:hypothetical protein
MTRRSIALFLFMLFIIGLSDIAFVWVYNRDVEASSK